MVSTLAGNFIFGSKGNKCNTLLNNHQCRPILYTLQIIFQCIGNKLNSNMLVAQNSVI